MNLMVSSQINPGSSMKQTFSPKPAQGILHLLVVVPGLHVRDALPPVLAECNAQGFWNHLNHVLKKTHLNIPVDFRDIDWNNIRDVYTLKAGQTSARFVDIIEESVRVVAESLGNVMKVLSTVTTVQEISWLVLTLMESVKDAAAADLQVRSGCSIESKDDRICAHGKADLLLQNGRNYVGLVAITTCTTSEDEMAKVIVGMEMANTFSKGELTTGILTDFRSWTFLRLQYPNDREGKVVVTFQTVKLLEPEDQFPKEDNLRCVVGKLLSVLKKGSR
ncbi:hypothetical protein PHYSODRAFT_301123 [Phytophthora sojae]|uniref:Uncharacterized protein n=1 Tax=Phytophthora sojae (strain P6497) TaxID=1094619 RepID=G4ZF38_PHYSP|nr:hypothetical protein PHYSODRAFT_301123 [Phytophthora sojae]EGZ18469.1 hypothetical protein PHYSODRAFT_301123 [Phytophthora sojae]|eukprot:XP_009527527.1 hypothetical protein PHYSODRAFT_301123 [Phytophthora sojae]